MCPGCVAYLAGKVIILMVALGLANLTDLKFGLWLLLGIVGQVAWDCQAIYSGEPPPIHPSFIFMQMVVLGFRGARLLQGPHWTKRLAESLGAKLTIIVGESSRSSSQSKGKANWLVRAGSRGWEFGKKPVRNLLLWTVGPLLSMLSDLRSAVWLLVIGAFLFGVHFQSFEIEQLGWGLGYVPMWMPLALVALALLRGVFAFINQPQHWLRSWILGDNGKVCRCPPTCPGCACCAPWLAPELQAYPPRN